MDKVLEKLKDHAKDTYQNELLQSIDKFIKGDRAREVIKSLLVAIIGITNAGRELEALGIAHGEYKEAVVYLYQGLIGC